MLRFRLITVGRVACSRVLADTHNLSCSFVAKYVFSDAKCDYLERTRRSLPSPLQRGPDTTDPDRGGQLHPAGPGGRAGGGPADNPAPSERLRSRSTRPPDNQAAARRLACAASAAAAAAGHLAVGAGPRHRVASRVAGHAQEDPLDARAAGRKQSESLVFSPPSSHGYAKDLSID